MEMFNFEIGDLVMYGLLAFTAVLVLWSLYRAHRTNGDSYYNKFNLIDLICARDGRIDRPAFLEIGTWALMSWGFIVLVTKQQWGLLVAYASMMTGVFVTRAAHAAYLKAHEKKPEETKS